MLNRLSANQYFLSLSSEQKNSLYKDVYTCRTPKSSYGEVSFEEFETNYSTTGWGGRKIVALLEAISIASVVTIQTLFQLALLPIVFLLKTSKELKTDHFRSCGFYLAAGYKEAFGWLVTLFNDKKGSYLAQKSELQRVCLEESWQSVFFALPRPPSDITLAILQENDCTQFTQKQINSLFSPISDTKAILAALSKDKQELVAGSLENVKLESLTSEQIAYLDFSKIPESAVLGYFNVEIPQLDVSILSKYTVSDDQTKVAFEQLSSAQLVYLFEKMKFSSLYYYFFQKRESNDPVLKKLSELPGINEKLISFVNKLGNAERSLVLHGSNFLSLLDYRLLDKLQVQQFFPSSDLFSEFFNNTALLIKKIPTRDIRDIQDKLSSLQLECLSIQQVLCLDFSRCSKEQVQKMFGSAEFPKNPDTSRIRSIAVENIYDLLEKLSPVQIAEFSLTQIRELDFAKISLEHVKLIFSKISSELMEKIQGLSEKNLQIIQNTLGHEALSLLSYEQLNHLDYSTIQVCCAKHLFPAPSIQYLEEVINTEDLGNTQGKLNALLPNRFQQLILKLDQDCFIFDLRPVLVNLDYASLSEEQLSVLFDASEYYVDSSANNFTCLSGSQVALIFDRLSSAQKSTLITEEQWASDEMTAYLEMPANPALEMPANPARGTGILGFLTSLVR